MWVDSMAIWSLTPAHTVLLEEACRIADRLDVLDGIIRRWIEPSSESEGGSGDISGFLAESRQQAGALKAILAEIRQGQHGAAPSAAAGEAGGAGVANLSARIAERRKKAEG